MTHKTIILLVQVVAAGFGTAAAVWLLQHRAPVWLYALIVGWGFLIAFVVAFREHKHYEEDRIHHDE